MRPHLRLVLLFAFAAVALSNCSSSGSSTPGEPGEKGPMGTTGATGATGATGTSGVGISTNKKIDASNTDYCDTDDLVCYFTGGQRVLLGDGTAIVTGEWSFLDQSASNDSDVTSATMVVPSTATNHYKVLGQMVRLPVANGGNGNTRKMFLVYTVSSDAVTLVWDKNNNGSLNDTASTDVLVTTLTLSNW